MNTFLTASSWSFFKSLATPIWITQEQAAEFDKASEYRQLLIQSIHVTAIKFSEVAASVVLALMEFLGGSAGSSASDCNRTMAPSRNLNHKNIQTRQGKILSLSPPANDPIPCREVPSFRVPNVHGNFNASKDDDDDHDSLSDDDASSGCSGCLPGVGLRPSRNALAISVFTQQGKDRVCFIAVLLERIQGVSRAHPRQFNAPSMTLRSPTPG
ncbi:hypothetical protein DFJ43DRAFT_1187547 [Lentinula guzmanii]|uniref:Uncharacterized protein n=1 Tax=Lentinula guzmanii TaxID=2804957 RepID=A0AA38JL44_9AGAR|nr:hypothetical protein DFJ43DRAFT_1187547 [Lentinula guzmanii]